MDIDMKEPSEQQQQFEDSDDEREYKDWLKAQFTTQFLVEDAH